MDNYKHYISAYMYELEVCLNKYSQEFKTINFQLDEANTDSEVKRLVKKIIKENLLTINNICTVNMDDEEVHIDKSKFTIDNILTIEEYTEIEKKAVKEKKDGVYVNPDLILNINFDGTLNHEFIEIKSTKNNNIPGSSIQQIDPNEWVIFIKHTDNDILTTIGQYKNSINGIMQFPDRSPRPQVSFSELKNWNNDFRTCENNILTYAKDDGEDTKENLLNDWQAFLAKRWMKALGTKRKPKNEPWFNNTVRKFALILLSNFQELSKKEQKKYLNFIKDNIKDGE
ncbi:MAG: hypothetical protein IJ358_02245 [Clostridia bacterium]|nr:hypothetical protein [Clostridia bacterium]